MIVREYEDVVTVRLALIAMTPAMLLSEKVRMGSSRSLEAIVSALHKETNIRAIRSYLSALGHLDLEEGVPAIAAFAEHESADIRFSVS